jgi:hypothetical protein
MTSLSSDPRRLVAPFQARSEGDGALRAENARTRARTDAMPALQRRQHRLNANRPRVGLTGFAYDWGKRQTTVTTPSGYLPSAPTMSFRLDGTPATCSLGNGETETISYDNDKRHTGIGLSGSGSSLSRAYDRVSNVTSEDAPSRVSRARLLRLCRFAREARPTVDRARSIRPLEKR